MSLTGVLILRAGCRTNSGAILQGFHTTSMKNLDQKWRQKRGLTENPNMFGPLTDKPDYSFKDGRPTPLGVRQATRVEKQRGYAERIIKLSGEIDYAVERHERLQEEERSRRQRILDSKLKPKGKTTIE